MYAFFSRSNFVTRHYNIKPKKKNIFEINTSNMVRSGDLGKSAEVFHSCPSRCFGGEMVTLNVKGSSVLRGPRGLLGLCERSLQ